MESKGRLTATINRRKMSYVGHVLRRKDISCELLKGSMYGNGDRGTPKPRYSGNTMERARIKSVLAIYRLAQVRDKWRATAVNCVPSVK